MIVLVVQAHASQLRAGSRQDVRPAPRAATYRQTVLLAALVGEHHPVVNAARLDADGLATHGTNEIDDGALVLVHRTGPQLMQLRCSSWVLPLTDTSSNSPAFPRWAQALGFD